MPLAPPTTSDILLYQSPDGKISLDVQLDHDTVWLTQAQMVELFATSKQNISLHTRNLFGRVNWLKFQLSRNP